jgi:hypothetical protein
MPWMLLLTGPHALRSCALTHRMYQTPRGTGAHTEGAPTIVVQPLVVCLQVLWFKLFVVPPLIAQLYLPPNCTPQPACCDQQLRPGRGSPTPGVHHVPSLTESDVDCSTERMVKLCAAGRAFTCQLCACPTSTVVLLHIATGSHCRSRCFSQSLCNSKVYACTSGWVFQPSLSANAYPLPFTGTLRREPDCTAY